MHVQSVLRLVTEPSQPSNARVASKVQLGRILDAQDDWLALHPLAGPLGMHFQELPPVQGRIVQEPIGRLGFRPATAGYRDAPRRPRRQVLYQPDQPPRPSLIP